MFTRIYIHIPFCRRKCPYCAFYSQEAPANDLAEYVRLLNQEMAIVSSQSTAPCGVESVYLGGGTPSLLTAQQLAGLLGNADRFFGLRENAEITLEANPGTVDSTKLTGFRQVGINRISLGVQSFDDRMLKALGRIHGAEQARESFRAARQAGFENISLDLIHALPGQTLHMWRTDLDQALELAPEHISVYGLTVEEGTPFAGTFPADSPLLPDDSLAAEMFETADELLTGHGYEHYEISNYARPGFRSQHNSGYWLRNGCLGLGAGAHSFLKDGKKELRFSNVSDLDAYAAAIGQGGLPRTDITEIAREDAVAEFMFLGLRLSEGVSFRAFSEEFGVDMAKLYAKDILILQEQGLLAGSAEGIRLTRRGMLLSNQVFRRFLP